MAPHFWFATWVNHSRLLIFGEQPEQFAHIPHFWWVTWAICSHCSLTKREWANRSILKIKNVYKTYKKIRFSIFLANIFWANPSFAHLSRATWANHLRSLICYEQPELFAHGHSFVLSNLSESLTVAHLSFSDLSESLTVVHLIWAKWANEGWTNEQIASPDFFTVTPALPPPPTVARKALPTWLQ